MNACERFMYVPLKHFSVVIYHYYTCPPFSGPVFVVLYFQILHFQSTRIHNKSLGLNTVS